MKTFIFTIVIPAFIAFILFSQSEGAFASEHGLHRVYTTSAWILSLWVGGKLAYHFAKLNKKK